MLIFIYKWQYYRALKTGLLIDYFFKKYIFFFWIKLLIQFNYFFNDKYLIEHISKSTYNTYAKIMHPIWTLQKIDSIYLINFILITILLTLFLLFLWTL